MFISSSSPLLKIKNNGTNICTPPLKGFRILSFDGALKGNPGPTDYGGIFRDENSFPLHEYGFS